MTEYDAEEAEEQPQAGPYILRWKWSNWDLVGIVATTTGGLFFSAGQALSVLGQGLNLLARECSAQANFSRHQYELAYQELKEAEQVEAYRAHQLEMAQTLHDIVEGPDAEEDIRE